MRKLTNQLIAEAAEAAWNGYCDQKTKSYAQMRMAFLASATSLASAIREASLVSMESVEFDCAKDPTDEDVEPEPCTEEEPCRGCIVNTGIRRAGIIVRGSYNDDEEKEEKPRIIIASENMIPFKGK